MRNSLYCANFLLTASLNNLEFSPKIHHFLLYGLALLQKNEKGKNMSLVQDFSELPSIDDLQPKILSPFSQKPVIKSTPLLNYGFILLNISTLTIIGLGIYTLQTSPYTGIRLAIENNTWIVSQ